MRNGSLVLPGRFVYTWQHIVPAGTTQQFKRWKEEDSETKGEGLLRVGVFQVEVRKGLETRFIGWRLQ